MCEDASGWHKPNKMVGLKILGKKQRLAPGTTMALQLPESNISTTELPRTQRCMTQTEQGYYMAISNLAGGLQYDKTCKNTFLWKPNNFLLSVLKSPIIMMPLVRIFIFMYLH